MTNLQEHTDPIWHITAINLQIADLTDQLKNKLSDKEEEEILRNIVFLQEKRKAFLEL